MWCLKGQVANLYVRFRFELDKDTFIDGWVNRSKQAGWTEGKFSMIEEILEAHMKYPDISTKRFEIRLISLYGKMGMLDHAHRVFEEILELNYNNGRVLDGGKIWCMVHDNRILEAVKLLKEMRSKGINPVVISYSALIKGICTDGKWEEAEWRYQNMLATL